MRSKLSASLLVVPLVLVAGCSNQAATDEAVKQAVAEALASQAPAEQAVPVAEAPPAVEPAPAPAPAAEPAETAPPAVVDFVMPDLRGTNLQVAQDQVQELGIFYSVSHDLLGMRNQMVDSNWQVCDQTPAAGTSISGPAADFEGTIDFGTVKLTERCP
jgi:hypothetical protein